MTKIIGTYIRNIKTYQGINYIPLSAGHPFCGLLGDNGIGKSSVLESIDSFFNSRPWNLNITTKKSGLQTSRPYILPVFLLHRDFFSPETLEIAENLSSAILSLEEEDIALTNRKNFKPFQDQIKSIIGTPENEEALVIPIGINHDSSITLGLFNCKTVGLALYSEGFERESTSISDELLEKLRPLYDEIKGKIEYIYIPKEIDPETFTKLETKEIQVLMGESLQQILEQRVTPDQIREINTKLNEFLSSISSQLDGYSYRTPTERQQQLRKGDIYSVIIDSFFKIRKLHRQQGESWLEIGNLSSGEKQKAILDVACSLLSTQRQTSKHLILAVDEPESSLHISACFDQFQKIFEISQNCSQLIFTSHWYGFLPVIENGSVTIISRKDSEHVFDTVNLEDQREKVKIKKRQSNGKLPYDIRLKSINDFIQSVTISTLSEQPYNWIICEGSSEKIYLSAYLSEEIDAKKIRIVPAGGASEIKKIYNHLYASLEDLKGDCKGKIFLFCDTDGELVEFETYDSKYLSCRRLVNVDSSQTSKFVKITSNPKSPNTEIEDCLNGRLFIETLRTFIADYPEELDFVEHLDADIELPARYALDLRPSESAKLTNFFDKDDNKVRFAKRYCEELAETYSIPEWVLDIKSFFK